MAKKGKFRKGKLKKTGSGRPVSEKTTNEPAENTAVLSYGETDPEDIREPEMTEEVPAEPEGTELSYNPDPEAEIPAEPEVIEEDLTEPEGTELSYNPDPEAEIPAEPEVIEEDLTEPEGTELSYNPDPEAEIPAEPEVIEEVPAEPEVIEEAPAVSEEEAVMIEETPAVRDIPVKTALTTDTLFEEPVGELAELPEEPEPAPEKAAEPEVPEEPAGPPHWIHDKIYDESYLEGFRYSRECRCSVCGMKVSWEKPVCPRCQSEMQ